MFVFFHKIKWGGGVEAVLVLLFVRIDPLTLKPCQAEGHFGLRCFRPHQEKKSEAHLKRRSVCVGDRKLKEQEVIPTTRALVSSPRSTEAHTHPYVLTSLFCPRGGEGEVACVYRLYPT